MAHHRTQRSDDAITILGGGGGGGFIQLGTLPHLRRMSLAKNQNQMKGALRCFFAQSYAGQDFQRTAGQDYRILFSLLRPTYMEPSA